MKLPHLQEGVFIQRLNRFAALVEVEGRPTMVHVANSGRMRELLQEGTPCSLAWANRPGRKTSYDLALVGIKGQIFRGPHGRSKGTRAGKALLVSADARLPNHLVWEALQEGRLTPFVGYTQFRREVVVEEGRLDLALDGPDGRCLVEVKSVTLVENSVGLFPDAPTERGRRHVGALAHAVEQGHRAAILFIIQREDARSCTPNDPADPAFGAALRQAVAQGVDAYAYICRVTRQEVRILRQVPLLL